MLPKRHNRCGLPVLLDGRKAHQRGVVVFVVITGSTDGLSDRRVFLEPACYAMNVADSTVLSPCDPAAMSEAVPKRST